MSKHLATLGVEKKNNKKNCLLQAETSNSSRDDGGRPSASAGGAERENDRGRETSHDSIMTGYEMDILIGLSCSHAWMGRVSPLCETHTHIVQHIV